MREEQWTGAFEPEVTDYIAMLAELVASTARSDEIFQQLLQHARTSPALTARLVAAAQFLRGDGAIDAEVAFALIATFVDEAHHALAEADSEFKAVDARIDAIERAHGLGEDEFWHVWEGPPEWTAANAEWDRLFAAVPVKFLTRHGEPEMAQLLGTNEVEFRRREDEGWGRIWGDEFED